MITIEARSFQDAARRTPMARQIRYGAKLNTFDIDLWDFSPRVVENVTLPIQREQAITQCFDETVIEVDHPEAYAECLLEMHEALIPAQFKITDFLEISQS